ncbi:hypothetical protein CEXT_548551 [Caerostris extrusa]|uniref:Uncharacterized protein n=1 Tax=Caerostris extrusa TaxID=172846 RepID=A0AAV4YBC8_CAEEX|nr:hypothetical protein CEXT_548551 [Caerostris extrusa]
MTIIQNIKTVYQISVGHLSEQKDLEVTLMYSTLCRRLLVEYYTDCNENALAFLNLLVSRLVIKNISQIIIHPHYTELNEIHHLKCPFTHQLVDEHDCVPTVGIYTDESGLEQVYKWDHSSTIP